MGLIPIFPSYSGSTPLKSVALKGGSYEFVTVLLQFGAKITDDICKRAENCKKTPSRILKSC